MTSTSIANRLNLLMLLMSLIILLFSAALITISYQINSSSDKIANVDIPLALNSLAMLEEFGDMNSNLLEYLSGESEEKQEYFDNYKEFIRFRSLMPKNSKFAHDIEKLDDLMAVYKQEAQNMVFGRYDPLVERATVLKVKNLLIEVGIPLENLLDEMKEEEISDVGSANSLEDVISDDLPGVRYYLELVDEAGDMLADLDRFTLGDTSSRKSFYQNALSFERYLAKLKPLEQKTDEIIRIREIERLFQQLKSTGKEVFDSDFVFSRNAALATIDSLEHRVFNRAELILDTVSEKSRLDALSSIGALNKVATEVNYILVFTTIGGIFLITVIFLYLKQAIFSPINNIAEIVSRLRQGERDIIIEARNPDDELGRVINNLKQFQFELSELDSLRIKEHQNLEKLAEERDRAQDALAKLEETQDRLGAIEELKIAEDKMAITEKLAALGTLVAGVAHEVNTPLGVSVTLATALEEKVLSFIDSIKVGKISKTQLDKFETGCADAFTLLNSVLVQASNLISNFKQVAVDQASSKRREFNLYQVMDEVLNTLHHQIKHTDITYSLAGDKSLEMDSYPGPLGQVITNLFNNSIIHGFETTEKGEIKIAFTQQADNISITFTDNGIGISQEGLKRIYDPFYTTKLGKGGSGLGLNIVHNIVTNLLGGEIKVLESDIGVVFNIIIPLISPITIHEGDVL